MGVEKYEPSDWRLFIDFYIQMKFIIYSFAQWQPPVLLVPVGHAKERYDELKKVLSLTKYNSHKLTICVNLKIVDFLFG